MDRDYKISVAMATYNGEKYIKEQLDSILIQLNENDELVISDDGSTDKTIDIINSYNDKRIKIIDGPHQGIIKNFENAIKNCSGKYIFLSDQDDIWENNKVDIVLKTFKKYNCSCVIHDCVVFNSDDNKIIYDSFFKFRKSRKGILKNIIKNSYIGCCMAIDSELKDNILPIPNDIYMHDQWIGIVCEKNKGSIFIKDKLIKYRRHNNTVTTMKHNSILKMIKYRYKLLLNLRRFK